MKIDQQHYTAESGWTLLRNDNVGASAQCVLVFGKREILTQPHIYNSLKANYPAAEIVLCSTAGEIVSEEVHEDTVIANALSFEHTLVRAASVPLHMNADSPSREAGNTIAKQLHNTEADGKPLKHLLVFSDGIFVNGSELVSGLSEILGDSVSITGGLAGDGIHFGTTAVALNSTPNSDESHVVAIGFFGEHFHVGYGSSGGWSSFGVSRLVTKSKVNVLYELDGKPALDLYKSFLGDKVNGLPASALLFPLSIAHPDAPNGELVRTILSIDEAEKTMTFAGDIPEGSNVRLMKASMFDLIDGAEKAGSLSMEVIGETASLAILISCVGRKIVLGQRIEDEIEAVREVIGTNTAVTGFYSYGELAPSSHEQKRCLLHNQTMTITLLSEHL